MLLLLLLPYTGYALFTVNTCIPLLLYHVNRTYPEAKQNTISVWRVHTWCFRVFRNNVFENVLELSWRKEPKPVSRILLIRDYNRGYGHLGYNYLILNKPRELSSKYRIKEFFFFCPLLWKLENILKTTDLYRDIIKTYNIFI